MQQRKGGIVFAVLVGLVVFVLSYRWAVDPRPREERRVQEQAVLQSRVVLGEIVTAPVLDIVDPLSPNRRVGKAYIYRAGTGWEVSGYYRRNENDLWHPYLVSLDAELRLTAIKLSDQDPNLVDQGKRNDKLDVLP